DLFGQYMLPQGFGGYASLPISYVSVGDGGSDAEHAIGNLEVGGAYVLNTPALPIALRAGVLLPTADDSLNGFLANAATVTNRLTDVASAMPDSTWLRLSVSPVLRRGIYVARVDLGADIPILGDGALEGAGPVETDLDPLMRA